MAYLNLNAISEFLGQFSVRFIYYIPKKLTILRKNAKYANFWLHCRGAVFPKTAKKFELDSFMINFVCVICA